MADNFIPHKDLELVKKCIEKDQEALNAFMDIYGNDINVVIKKRLFLENQKYFADISQDIFRYLFSGTVLLNYKGISSLKAYLRVIVSRKTMKFLMDYKKKEIESSFDIDIMHNSAPLQNELIIYAKEILKEMRIWDASKTEFFEMNKIEKTSYRELEELFHISKSSIGRQINIAEKKFKNLFNKKKPRFFKDVSEDE